MITEEKRAEWLHHVEDWKRSKLSISAYCMKSGINKSTFRYWIDRNRSKIKTKKGRIPEQQTCLRPGESFVKLNLQNSLPVSDNKGISLKYGSFEIKIPTAFNKQDLKDILEVLESRIKCY